MVAEMYTGSDILRKMRSQAGVLGKDAPLLWLSSALPHPVLLDENGSSKPLGQVIQVIIKLRNYVGLLTEGTELVASLTL